MLTWRDVITYVSGTSVRLQQSTKSSYVQDGDASDVGHCSDESDDKRSLPSSSEQENLNLQCVSYCKVTLPVSRRVSESAARKCGQRLVHGLTCNGNATDRAGGPGEPRMAAPPLAAIRLFTLEKFLQLPPQRDKHYE